MAYEALLARRAFPQESPVALARAIMDAPPPPIRVLRPDVDPVLGAVIDRAMSHDARHRFGSAEQMRSALAGDHTALFAGAAPLAGPPPRPATKVLSAPLAPSANYFVPAPPRRRFSSRTRKALIAAAVLAAFTVSMLALAMDHSSTTQPPEPVVTSTPAPTPTSAPPPLPPPVPVLEKPGKKKGDDDGDDDGRGNGNEGNRGRGTGRGGT
jgi:hypothetical protein